MSSFLEIQGSLTSMRSASQIAVVAVVAGLGAGWYFHGDRLGLPDPLALVGLEPVAEANANRTSGGARVQVVTAEVREAAVVERIESIGTARAREAVTITSRVSGIVTAIGFEEGQKVEARDVLIELDRSQQVAALDRSRAVADDARTKLDRARRLRATQAVAEAQIDQLEAGLAQAEAQVREAAAKVEEMKIIAPFAGRVGLRQVSLGALIQPGTVVTTLDDLSRLRVEFAVPEVFTARLAVGQRVVATSRAFGERRFEGDVTVVDTRIDPATRTVRAVAEFPNPDETLKPGLFLNIALTLAERPVALLVPEEAIDPVGDRTFVYAVRDGRAVRREVRLGMRAQGEVEVVSGVTAEDQVVVRGLQRLRDGVPVHVTEVVRRPVS
jgi:membrane fusion protein (multidrug efflux system)